jgi:hypothetical protein
MHNGVIELFEQLKTKLEEMSNQPLDEDDAEETVRRIALDDFVVHTTVPRVDLMLAGRFDLDYGDRMSRFDWRRLFDRAPSLIRALAELLAERYDYVLVDSRTGFNEISGICTALLPDQLVLVFTPNRQSLLGGIDAVRRATHYRIQSEDLRPLAVFPLPSRIDVSEPELLEKWRFGDSLCDEDDEGYQSRFENLFVQVYGLPSCNLKNYFDEVQIQHIPRYSYGEEIAALRERGTRLSISRSYATFADILAKNESAWSMPPSAQGRAELVSGVAPTVVKIEAAKGYLSEPRYRLKLHDLITREVSAALTQVSRFGFQAPASSETFAQRLNAYEASVNDLLLLQALLGYWGEADHHSLLVIGPKRLCDQISPQGGLTIWLASRWYPAMLLLYSGGIGAVAAHRYENLYHLMVSPVAYPFDPPSTVPTLIHAVAEGINELDRLKAFSQLSGLGSRYTPRSDYLHKLFEPLVQDLLFLGSEYDTAFDEFEMLYALENGYRYHKDYPAPFSYWGPVGRFAWKGSSLDQLIAKAEAEDQSWPPLRAGFFGGSLYSFKEAAITYRKMIQTVTWG